jgi:hypothetical protein
MAVVVLWKLRDHGRLMQVPYELVEIILRHLLRPQLTALPRHPHDSSDDSELGSECNDLKSDNQEHEIQHAEDDQDQGHDSDRESDDDDEQDESDCCCAPLVFLVWWMISWVIS